MFFTKSFDEWIFVQYFLFFHSQSKYTSGVIICEGNGSSEGWKLLCAGFDSMFSLRWLAVRGPTSCFEGASCPRALHSADAERTHFCLQLSFFWGQKEDAEEPLATPSSQQTLVHYCLLYLTGNAAVWLDVLLSNTLKKKKKNSFLWLLFAFKRCFGVPIWCCWYRTHVLFSFVFLNVIPATSLWPTQWTEPLRSAGTTPAAAHRAQTALS